MRRASSRSDRSGEAHGMVDIDTLRRGYRSFGLGVAEAMLTMFDPGPDEEGVWEVGGPRSKLVTGSQSPPYDLFGGEQPGWTIVRVEADDFTERGDVIAVTGHVFWRPVRGWEITPVPFIHIWTLRDHRPVRVLSYLDGIELSRVVADGPA